jgi:hypothetical protein
MSELAVAVTDMNTNNTKSELQSKDKGLPCHWHDNTISIPSKLMVKRNGTPGRKAHAEYSRHEMSLRFGAYTPSRSLDSWCCSMHWAGCCWETEPMK